MKKLQCIDADNPSAALNAWQETCFAPAERLLLT